MAPPPHDREYDWSRYEREHPGRVLMVAIDGKTRRKFLVALSRDKAEERGFDLYHRSVRFYHAPKGA